MLSRNARLILGVVPVLAALAVAATAAGTARPVPATPRASTGVAGAALAAAGAVALPPPAPAQPAACPPEPPLEARALEHRPPMELARAVREEPRRLGSASIGTPTRGALWGGVELLPSDGIERAGGYPWGTETVVRSIERAVREVRRCFPGTPRLHVGDISRKEGGWLRPHRSHQSGLDADVGYYYVSGPAWFRHADASTLDRPRTWALLRALVDGGNVEMIFIDTSVQRLLREHAEAIGEEQPVVDAFFPRSPGTRHQAILQHARGHGTHLHVRFRDPASVALGLRLAPMLRGNAAAIARRAPARR